MLLSLLLGAKTANGQKTAASEVFFTSVITSNDNNNEQKFNLQIENIWVNIHILNEDENEQVKKEKMAMWLINLVE